MNKFNSVIGLSLAGCIFLLIASGCRDNESHEDIMPEEMDVPLTFMVQSSSNSAQMRQSADVDLRSGEIPGEVNIVRDLYVDNIQVNIYKRATGVYAGDTEGFVFDRKMVLTCKDPSLESGENYKYAFDNIKLDKYSEYRITAFGYSLQKQERELFSFPESGSFVDARIALTDASQYSTPELFFGTVRYGNESDGSGAVTEVFKYEKGMTLTGWLYRCVAGIEVTLRDVPEDVSEITLLSGAVSTECRATCYDDFLTPDVIQEAPEAYRSIMYRLASWRRSADLSGSVNLTLKDCNLLPVKTPLSVRFVKGGKPYVVALRMRYNGADSGMSAEDLAQGIVGLKRNHYYQISGDFQSLATQNLYLILRVNPNWEGDADLSLGGK